MKTFLVFILVFGTVMQAEEDDYLKSIEFCKTREYEKALPAILHEAQNENRAAQYRLAQMYEKGYGIAVDNKQAMYWYKRASSEFSFVENTQTNDANTSYLEQVEKQIGDESFKRGNEFALFKMDTDTPETKKLVHSLTSGGFFGLQPYKTNFLLPLSYGKNKPLRYPSSYHLDDPNIPVAQEHLAYGENSEIEFQLSLQKQVSYNLLGLNEYLYFAYTQKVWWQFYANSAPFRETNYLPEVFITIPSSQSIDKSLGLKSLKFGFLHESNGQEGYRSRSWNRLYLAGAWQWDNWFLSTRVWYRIPEDEKPSGYYQGQLGPEFANESGDDNPDIHKYLGYGDLKLDYLNGRSQYGLLIRNNLRFNRENKGAVEFNWSYSIFSTANTFLYVKLFHGYGESLISYNQEVSKAAIGFSFSRELF